MFPSQPMGMASVPNFRLAAPTESQKDESLTPLVAELHLTADHPTLQQLPIVNKGAKMVLFSADQDFNPNKFTHISKLAPQLCENGKPRSALFSARKELKPLTHLLAIITKDGFYQEREMPSDQRKACLYHWAMSLLAWETHYLTIFHACLEGIRESEAFAQQKYSLESHELFAYHIRHVTHFELAYSTQASARSFLEKTKTPVGNDSATQMHRILSRIYVCQGTIMQALGEMETCFSLAHINSVVKRITPLLGFFVACSKDQFRKVEWVPGEVIASHGLQSAWFTAMKQILLECSEPYFSDQMRLYEKASECLNDLLKKYPAFNASPFNFTRLLGMNGSNVPSVAQYQQEIKELLQQITPEKPKQTPLSKEEMAYLLAGAPKKGGKPKPAAKQAPADKERKDPQATSNSPKELPTPTISPLLQAMLAAPALHHHKRVIRWLKIDPKQIEKVRLFTDYREQKPVQLYADMPAESLQEQLLLHGFSPHVDKIISNEHLRQKYALQTASGYSLIVEILREKKPAVRGIACYALQNGLCYHRMIEPRADNEFFSKPLKEVAKARWLNVDPQEVQLDAEETLKQELASEFIGDSFSIDPQTEILQFLDRKNGCWIYVFPIA